MVLDKQHPRYEHVKVRAVGVGEVTFLQNHYHDLHVAVHEVDSEVGVRCCPLLTVPHQTPDEPIRSRKRDPIDPGIRCDNW